MKKTGTGPPIGNRSSRLAVERNEDREVKPRRAKGERKKGPSPHGRLSSFEDSVAPPVTAVVSLNRNHSATMNCLPIILQISLFSRWGTGCRALNRRSGSTEASSGYTDNEKFPFRVFPLQTASKFASRDISRDISRAMLPPKTNVSQVNTLLFLQSKCRRCR